MRSDPFLLGERSLCELGNGHFVALAAHPAGAKGCFAAWGTTADAVWGTRFALGFISDEDQIL
ncbi:MAG: hypothetical protein QNJ40_26630, partial [Xanthomonadales bacterium]|nr:hypothetical protein [Xanthomonadales bacterium]